MEKIESCLAVQIEHLFTERKFDEMCSLFRQHETDQLPLDLLLRKSAAIQLAEDASGYSLNDAKRTLEQATSTFPDSPLPWIELGYFFFAVEDNPVEALRCFENAQAGATPMLENLALGLAGALKELDRVGEAVATLRRYETLMDSTRLTDARKDLADQT